MSEDEIMNFKKSYRSSLVKAMNSLNDYYENISENGTDTIWTREINDTSLSETDKLVIRIVYLSHNIFLEDLATIFKPILQYDSFVNVISKLVKLKYLVRQVKNMGVVLASGVNSVKQLDFNRDNSARFKAVEISENQLYTYKTIHAIHAHRILHDYLKPYIEMFELKEPMFKVDYIVTQYCKHYVYNEYLKVAKNSTTVKELKIEFLMNLNIPQENAAEIVEQSNSFAQKMITECILEFPSNKKIAIYNRVIRLSSEKGLSLFDVMFDFINEIDGRSKYSKTEDIEEIHKIRDIIMSLDNNFFKNSNRRIRKYLKNAIQYDEVMLQSMYEQPESDEDIEEKLKDIRYVHLNNEFQLSRYLQRKMAYSGHLRSLGRRILNSSEILNLEEDVYKQEVLKEVLDEIDLKIEALKRMYHISSYKIDDDTKMAVKLNPTFESLINNSVYIESIHQSKLEVIIAIVDNTSDALEPSVIFNRIWMAYYMLKELDSQIDVHFNIYTCTKSKYNYVMKTLETAKQRMDRDFKDQGFGDLTNRIQVKLTKINIRNKYEFFNLLFPQDTQ